MDTLRELEIKRNKLKEQAAAIHAKAEEENRDLTDIESTEFDQVMADCDAVGVEIKAIQDAAERRTARASRLKAVDANVTDSSGDRISATVTGSRIEIGKNLLSDDPAGGYGECGEPEHMLGAFALDVVDAAGGRVAPRLQAWQTAILGAAGDGLTTKIGHEGAYLLPQQQRSLIDRIALEAAVIRPRATVIPMTSQSVSFPTLDDTDHSGNTVFGGVQAYFTSEEAQLTSTKPKFGSVRLELNKLTALAYVSGEMLDWSPLSMASWLPRKLGEAMTWKEEDKFINGLGAAGEPTGILNTPCSLQISKETGQAATTIDFLNIVKMDARTWAPGGRGNLFWLCNQTCKVQLAQMTLTVGTGGVPVFLPANQAAGQPLQTLYGYPILFTEHCQALGTVGDIFLVNGAEYYIGDGSSKGRTDRNIGLKFDYDQTAFRVITYVGGMCPWRTQFTPQNGDSLSPITKLQSRT